MAFNTWPCMIHTSCPTTQPTARDMQENARKESIVISNSKEPQLMKKVSPPMHFQDWNRMHRNTNIRDNNYRNYRMQMDPISPKCLPADALDKVAPPILFNRFVTLWTRLCVNYHPVNSIWFIIAFLCPKIPHTARAWWVGHSKTSKAELMTTTTFNLRYITGIDFIHTNRISAMWNTGAPFYFVIVLNVWLQQKTVKMVSEQRTFFPDKISNNIFITNCIAPVSHAFYSFATSVIYFDYKMICPT